MQRVFPVPFLIAILLVAGIVGQSLVRFGVEVTFTEEVGGMERAALVLWVYAAGVALYSRSQLKGFAWPVALLFLLFALRELDFHNWWFEPGLLRGEIFSSDAPLWQKAVSATAMLSILAVVLIVLVGGGGRFLGALRHRKLWPWLVLLAVALAALSTVFDGLGPRLRPYGIEVDDAMHLKITMGEEILEFLFSFLLVAALAFGIHDAERSNA